MVVRRLDPNQPKDFVFTPGNLDWAREMIENYPEGRQAAAVIPLLWRAQEQHAFWLPEPAIRYVADLLDMPYIRVYEIATFYTMFNLSPVGKHHVQLCGTTPCMLRGAEDIKRVCRTMIGEEGAVSADGILSWVEVECLGACVNAPMVQINTDYFEDLTPDNFTVLLAKLREGVSVKPGPQSNRQLSSPAGGPKTLKNVPLYKSAGYDPGPENKLTDAEAKEPTESANMRESPAPKPPIDDKSSPGSS
ncbi:MAG: NADH-quinone oxidoreductase subunit NuoE [Hyphomicrobiales bacterium]|nr:NADH-quinone oxidoreductase subunit NuoE [Hyphomicrobiales bacterium]